jgi:Putative phage tail protein
MATLIFSALGTLIGGPLGGAIGALAGRAVDSAILGGGNREGPRLKDLAVTASSYGTALPRHFGRMRVAGSVIWATNLVEHKQKQGGGKGRPSVTTYSYTASFAVALASRPIQSVGRIWADGNLLRGAAGDLKVNGTFRLYTGEGDQLPDPLIAEIEGEAKCPAWRGLAYVVFEDLDLGEFFNRIPSLTFELFADSGVLTVQTLLGDVVTDTAAPFALEGIDGFSCESPLVDTLTLLEPMFPIDCDAGGELLTFARGGQQASAIALPEASISVGDGEFGARSGFARKRAPQAVSPPEVLRFYDIDRDYQPGLQRATGRTGPGQPRHVELPAALTAANARVLAERMAHRAAWARETLAWRTSDLDPAVAPGAIVTVPDQSGRWRVSDWEWRESGIELSLTRLAPSTSDAASTVANLPADSGRANPPVDELAPPTILAAFELPWDGSGNGDAPAVFAAASSAGTSWSGAALYVDHGDGALQPLGVSGRGRSVLGTAVGVLAPANPLLFDRMSTVTVELLAEDMELTGATPRNLALGANRALLGNEIIQFGRAVPLGNRRWRLETLLRGRGGTESAIAGHVAGEHFVLLDGQPVALDPTLVGTASSAMIAAVGLGDTAPVVSAILLQGSTLRPLSPVQPRTTTLADGSLDLIWTRRSRGAWTWPDGVDAPLREQNEAYLVTYGPLEAPEAMWEVTTPNLSVSASQKAALAAAVPGEAFRVRQRGTYALSEHLVLTHLP